MSHPKLSLRVSYNPKKKMAGLKLLMWPNSLLKMMIIMELFRN